MGPLQIARLAGKNSVGIATISSKFILSCKTRICRHEEVEK